MLILIVLMWHLFVMHRTHDTIFIKITKKEKLYSRPKLTQSGIMRQLWGVAAHINFAQELAPSNTLPSANVNRVSLLHCLFLRWDDDVKGWSCSKRQTTSWTSPGMLTCGFTALMFALHFFAPKKNARKFSLVSWSCPILHYLLRKRRPVVFSPRDRNTDSSNFTKNLLHSTKIMTYPMEGKPKVASSWGRDDVWGWLEVRGRSWDNGIPWGSNESNELFVFRMSLLRPCQ